MVVGVAHSADRVLADLDDALDRALAFGWSDADRDELASALRRVPTLRNRVDALAGTIAQRAHNSGATGTRHAHHFMGAETNEPPGEVRQDMLAMRWLDDFVAFREAYTAGELSRRHVELLRRADTPTTHRAMLGDQDLIATWARDCTFDGFGTALQYWVNAADPDGKIPDEQTRRTTLRLHRHNDGSLTIKGQLDPLLGTALYNAVQAEATQLRRQDLDAGIDRPYYHRRAAALVGLVARGALRSDGSSPTPLINVVASHEVLVRLLASQADPDVELGLDPRDLDGRCEFIDGTPIHPRLLLALFGVANFRRIVLDAESRPIDVSHNARSFPRWMKDAALVSTRGRCIERGCDARFHWLHADHRQPWSKGGRTQLGNLDPLCSQGNRAKGDTWPPDEPAA